MGALACVLLWSWDQVQHSTAQALWLPAPARTQVQPQPQVLLQLPAEEARSESVAEEKSERYAAHRTSTPSVQRSPASKVGDASGVRVKMATGTLWLVASGLSAFLVKRLRKPTAHTNCALDSVTSSGDWAMMSATANGVPLLPFLRPSLRPTSLPLSSYMDLYTQLSARCKGSFYLLFRFRSYTTGIHRYPNQVSISEVCFREVNVNVEYPGGRASNWTSGSKGAARACKEVDEISPWARV